MKLFSSVRQISVKKTTKTALLSSLVALTSVSANADTFLGIYADANAWMPESTSTISNKLLDQKVNFGSVTGANVSIAIEHIVPVIPNFRVRHTMLDMSKDVESAKLKVGTVNLPYTVATEVNMSQTDLLVYYEILDNIVSVDVGVGAKLLKADFSTKGKILTLKDDIEEVAPLLYVSAGGSLPFTGLSAKADVAGIKYKDNQVIDAQAELKYNFIDLPVFDFGAKVGYRIIDLKTNKLFDSNLAASYKGPYVGLEAHF